MSATCPHPDAEAFAHPECAGCAAVVTDVAAAAGAKTATERAAVAHPERPGIWAGEANADLRELTQAETDELIRVELRQLLDFVPSGAERTEMENLLGPHRGVKIDRRDLAKACSAQCQRGGIASDPRVRLLAFRVWGDRDIRWSKDRGV